MSRPPPSASSQHDQSPALASEALVAALRGVRLVLGGGDTATAGGEPAGTGAMLVGCTPSSASRPCDADRYNGTVKLDSLPESWAMHLV